MKSWLSWAVLEYGLHQLDVRQFSHIDGKSLCAMELRDFVQRTTRYNGEVLMHHLQWLRQGSYFFFVVYMTLAVSFH